MIAILGVAAPFVYVDIYGWFAAYVDLPTLRALSRQFGAAVKPWLPAYRFAGDLGVAALSSIILGLPLALLARQHRPVAAWLLFAISFWLAYLWASWEHRDLFLAAFTDRGMWLFLVLAFVLIVEVRRRANKAVSTATA